MESESLAYAHLSPLQKLMICFGVEHSDFIASSERLVCFDYPAINCTIIVILLLLLLLTMFEL